ncbi:hypothetical protein FPZ12_025120 [Amycolatopsis acidicola]|uniref:Integral membrane bound transporter domain-containing protein n=1 Tax=Amycolatopsis acidicola TaxID=2596893 RepID=A0A5N0V0B3_9PSEU|nr:FUSC family protein [Amycolatopsis acidicola]KAA9157456.1 hypothetical protein FPZ12_025120 [Amycolatopsis acidicola]
MTEWSRFAGAFRTRWPVGLRAGLSVGIPLLVLVPAGRPDWGAIASLGGIAGVYGAGTPYRYRVRLVAAIGLALAVVVPVSSLCGSVPWLSVLFVGVVAGVAGFVCLATRIAPPREYLIILATLVATGTPVDFRGAMTEFALVAGGALTALLVAALVLPRTPETGTVARAWQAIDEVLRTAGTPQAGGARRQAVSEVTRARETLRQARAGRGDERTRSLAAAEVVLTWALSVSIDAKAPLDPASWEAALHRPGERTDAPELPGLREISLTADRILRGEAVDEVEPARLSLTERLRDALNPHAVVLPAAARTGVAVAIGVLLGRLLGLGHAYWVGLTVAAALQATNVTLLVRRAAHRIVGTIAGVALAAVVFAADPPLLAVAFVVIVAQGVSEILMPVSYGVAVVFVTLVPLSLYDLAVPSAQVSSAVGARVLDTAIGAVLVVLLRVLLWPRATAARLPQVQARTLRSVAEVFRGRWLDGDEAELRENRRLLREQVLDLHNIAEDARADRVRGRDTDRITLAVDELAMLALGVPFGRPHPAREQGERLVNGLRSLADALGRGTAPGERPPPIPGYPRVSAASELLATSLG